MQPNTPVDPHAAQGWLPRSLRYERWRWQVFAITWLAYFGFYLTRKSFAVAKIGMGEGSDVGLSSKDMTWIDGAYLVSYAAGQFLWGFAGDRVGPRRVVLGGLLGSVLAGLAMGASSLTLSLGVAFFFQGLFQATGWGPLTKNVRNFFSRRERGWVFGLWSTHYAAGGLVASVYAGFWGDRLGWRYAFFIPAATLFGVVVLFWLFQRDRPEDVGLPPVEVYHGEEAAAPAAGEARAPAEGNWAALGRVLLNPNVLVLSVVYLLLKPTRYAILFWGPKYIHAKLGSDMTESGLISGMFEVAGIFSTLAAGFISDWWFRSKRIPVCVLCLLALGGFLLFFDSFPTTPGALSAGMLVIGLLVFAPDSMIAGVAAVDFGTKRGASTAAGLVNGAGSVGAVVGGTLPGFFSEAWGWSGVFTFLAGMALLAGLILLPWWNAVPAAANGAKHG
jgi:OPA family sugar phosphate sensor protein UhpC-like MFS transporter